jgi:hypothetical protein
VKELRALALQTTNELSSLRHLDEIQLNRAIESALHAAVKLAWEQAVEACEQEQLQSMPGCTGNKLTWRHKTADECVQAIQQLLRELEEER